MHPLPLSSVYTWGSGISTPLRLPMLNTEVIQVSLGRTQKMGVTKSGKLITWEVWWSFFFILIEYHWYFISVFSVYFDLTPCQAPSVGSGEPTLPGAVEQMQPQFISRFLEGQSGVTIKSVSCGDLFTTCLTGMLLTIQNFPCRSQHIVEAWDFSSLTPQNQNKSWHVHQMPFSCLSRQFLAWSCKVDLSMSNLNICNKA